MGYEQSLEAAGAIVHEFKEFGDYQGTWLALVTYEGETGWIEGSYGSCSGCDSFQAEFDSWDEEEKPDYKDRLAEFGKGYLHSLVKTDQLVGIYLRKCEDGYAWDDDKEILAYLKSKNASEIPTRE